MRPFSRLTPIKISLVTGAWTVYGLLCAWQTHYWYSFSKMPLSWAECLRYQLTYSSLWALCTPLVVWAARQFRFERGRWPRNLVIHLIVMAFAVSATKLVFDVIVRPDGGWFPGASWGKIFRSIESTLDTGPLLYAMIVLIEHAIIYYQRYQSGLVKASQLQTQLVQSQLKALRMQLHPHFLFNALHTIAALVHEDPDLAERTIARLGELLRLFLATSSVQEVTLSEEIRVLDLYLEIERARFEERLHVRYEVPPGVRHATVPNLVLQPLVENSIRHGIGKRAEPGWIAVAADREGDTLVLKVTDNGEGFRSDPLKPVQGMGLAITRGRLESLYGPNQSLVLRNVPGGGVEVRITLPFRTETTSNEKDHVELQSADR
jgi:two-component system LytT family sensor kinase